MSSSIMINLDDLQILFPFYLYSFLALQEQFPEETSFYTLFFFFFFFNVTLMKLRMF